MCGRFEPILNWSQLTLTLEIMGIPPRPGALFEKPMPEIRPTNQYPVIRLAEDRAANSRAEIAWCRWQLIPHWFTSNLSDFKLSTFNARIEEVADRSSFRSALRSRHCIIPVSSFWEWWGAHPSGAQTKKQRWQISRADNLEMVFAGIWDRAHLGDGTTIESFTIMTRPAGTDLGAYHTREPIVLKPDEYADWLHCRPVASIDPAAGIWPSAPAGTFRFAPAQDIPSPPGTPKRPARMNQIRLL